ncbi:hypothetical protein EV702DRAFT_1277067 [Suillus placidus]|uniref:WD40 repeat-like protein n=1 Tax=Suillus placidus TaxID=48579 RepID=A0A9P7D5C8_9AGAM|nr:hypothetical protein EV702DRAFT_1277067 [Suillus placidus]
MISGSGDKTIRRWDLREGKEIKEDREVGDDVHAVGVSRDGRWVATAAGRKLKVSEGIVRTFYEGDWGSSASTSHLREQYAALLPHSPSRRMTTPGRSIIEFDASTLKTVGAPFKHISPIRSLALSSDCVLLASFSYYTIKLWAFESRQLLASFDVKSPITLVLSPDSRQLAYTSRDDTKISICNIPVNILASIGQLQPSTNKSKRPRHAGLLNSDATRPVRRKPVIIPVVSSIPRPLTTSDPHAFLPFLRKFLSSSSRTNAVRTDEPRNPLDFPATSPLPRPFITPDQNSRSTPAPLTTQSSAINTPATLKSSLRRLSTWWPLHTDHASPPIVDVPLAPGKLRYATAGAPGDDDDLIRDEDYVSPPPSPNPGSRPGIVNTGQHGSGRFCFCF